MTTPEILNILLHNFAMMSLLAALIVTALAFRSGMSDMDVRRLLHCDIIHALSTLTIFVTGILRLFHFQTTAYIVVSNHWFLLKLFLAISFLILSFYPSIIFNRWRQAVKQKRPSMISFRQVNLVRYLIRLELFSLLCMPILVTLARHNFY